MSLEKPETKPKLAELVGALADAKLELAEVQNLLLDKEKIMTLEQTLHTKKYVLRESPWYWYVDEGKKDGPFCQQCYGKDDTLNRLQDYRNGYWGCLNCKNSYNLGGESGIAKVETDSNFFSGWIVINDANICLSN
jgi:hypothetical protein